MIPKEIIQKLKEKKAKRVFVQLPEGLIPKLNEIKKDLEKNGFIPFFCLEATYGACDLRDEEALRLKCDCILHIGHSDFGLKSKLPIIYWEYVFEIDESRLSSILEKEIKKLKNFEKIGLVTSLQYVKSLKFVKKFLEKIGKKVFVEKSLKYEGQILGCNISSALKIKDRVDCFLVISEGKFYPLALLKIDKPVLCLDLEKGEIIDMKNEFEKYKKIVAWYKNEFEKARTVGLLVSWKKGQIFYDVEKIKEKIEKMGKEVYVFVMDEIDERRLEGIKVDFLINLACPRIFDGYERFKIPLLNLSDLNLF